MTKQIIPPLYPLPRKGINTDPDALDTRFEQLRDWINEGLGVIDGENITNSTIDGSPIGQTTPSTAAFTSLSAQTLSVAGEAQVGTAVNPNDALPLGQANSLYAPVSGNASQTFAVATAASGSEAVPLAQANSLYAPVSGNASQAFAVATAASGSEAVPLAQALTYLQGGSATYASDTGTAGAYAVTLSPPITALTPGMTVRFKAANANTGASTLNVNGLGAIAITAAGGQALTAGQIVAGGHYEVIYSSSANQWLLLAQSAGAVAVANATASNQAVNLGQFASSFNANSFYLKLPNGIIVQGGITPAISAGSSQFISLPISFVTSFISVVASYTNSASTSQATGGNPINCYYDNSNLSGFGIYNGGNLSAQYSYVALGY